VLSADGTRGCHAINGQEVADPLVLGHGMRRRQRKDSAL